MKLAKVLVAALLVSACSTNPLKKKSDTPDGEDAETEEELAGLQANRYRGYDAVNYVVSQRLFQDENFKLSYYIEDTDGLGIFAAFVSTLKDLLGSRFGTGLLSGFRSGSPNSVNATLWSLAFAGLANDVKGICQAEGGKIGPFEAKESFRNAALALCAWPLASHARRPALEVYWREMVQLDAPSEERAAWLAFAESNEMLTLPADQVLYNLTFAAFYNPHFLIAK